MRIFEERGHHKTKGVDYTVYITCYGRYFPRRLRELRSLFRYLHWHAEVHVHFDGDPAPYHHYEHDFSAMTLSGLVRQAHAVGEDVWIQVHNSPAEEWWV